jgi:hypothetical protein
MLTPANLEVVMGTFEGADQDGPARQASAQEERGQYLARRSRAAGSCR